jgi:hypothetical protein
MTFEEALAFVRNRGVALASGKGAVPNVVEAIVNEPVKGSWWAHPRGKEIFGILRELSESQEILVCRLVGGKVTYVHRRLWPALVRAADHFPVRLLAQVREEHTASGRHITRDVPFPEWVPADVVVRAAKLDKRKALDALGKWVVSDS